MQIFTNSKRRFNSFMEYYVIHSKKQAEKIMLVSMKFLVSLPALAKRKTWIR